MQKKKKMMASPTLFPVSVCLLMLAFTLSGCDSTEVLVQKTLMPEPGTKQPDPFPAQRLKRTPSPANTPSLPKPLPAQPVSPQESGSFPEPSPPSLAENLSAKGESAYRQEDYNLSEKRFREALVHEPELLHALTGLGWTLYDSERPDEAFFYFERAKNLYPESGSARRGFAYLLYRYGRLKEARALLGSLDKARWPELANIDEGIMTRAGKKMVSPPLKTPEPKIQPESKPDPRPKTETAKPRPPEPAPETVKSSLLPVKPVPPPPVRKPSLEGMVKIPGGSFMMGIKFTTRKRSRARWRRRRAAVKVSGGRPVEVASFRLDKFEITNSLYADFLRATKGAEPPFWHKVHFTGPHLPVVGVTWDEARAYCSWAGKRLPTEAEWEYAAQGAGKGRRYPWGNTQHDRNAVFGLSPDAGGPKAVGRRPEGTGLHGVEDLAGNVWEWVADEFRTNPGDTRPITRNGQVLRTLKGGSWVNGWWALASSHRTGDIPDRRLPAYGFRCAADAPE